MPDNPGPCRLVHTITCQYGMVNDLDYPFETFFVPNDDQLYVYAMSDPDHLENTSMSAFIRCPDASSLVTLTASLRNDHPASGPQGTFVRLWRLLARDRHMTIRFHYQWVGVVKHSAGDTDDVEDAYLYRHLITSENLLHFDGVAWTIGQHSHTYTLFPPEKIEENPHILANEDCPVEKALETMPEGTRLLY